MIMSGQTAIRKQVLTNKREEYSHVFAFDPVQSHCHGGNHHVMDVYLDVF